MNAAARAAAAAQLDRGVVMTKDQAGRVAPNSARLPECSVDNAQVIADE
jgi:hypothetical protein